MPKTLPIQETFVSGELSPLLYGQVSSDAYKSGLKTALNSVTNDHGPVEILRKGLQYLESFSTDIKKVLVLPGEGLYYLFFFNDTEVTAYSFYDGTLTLLTVNYGSAYPYLTDEIAENLDFAYQPSERTVIIFSGWNIPKQMYWDSATSKIQFDNMAYTAIPAEWTVGGPGDPTYPKVGAFHQSRLLYSGVKYEDSRIWGSKTDDWYNLTTGALADDALDFYLTDPGEVRWLVSTKHLLVGTDTHEVAVTSDGGFLIPGDIKDETQSGHGSASIHPISDGNTVIFVGRDSKKIYEMNYDWTIEGWAVRDLTFSSGHMFTSDLITGIAYTSEPLNLLGVQLNSGNFAMATYNKDNKVLGWHYHQTEQGVVDSILSVVDHATGSGELLFFIERQYLTDMFTLERYGDRYMDSWKDLVIDGTAITDMAHLAGETVRVMLGTAEGRELHADVTLDGSGEGTLSSSFTGTITVGLAYTGQVRLLPLIQRMAIGSTMPLFKKWAKAYLYLVNSYMPEVQGFRLNPSLHADQIDGTSNADTDIYQIAVTGWDKKGELLIQQDLPFPVTLAAIFGEVLEETL